LVVDFVKNFITASSSNEWDRVVAVLLQLLDHL